MQEHELLSILDEAVDSAVIYSGSFQAQDEKAERYYFGEPFGDERPNRSSVISTDVADVIEADMPSLVRVFLGSSEILKFEAMTENPKDIQEAEEKTAYINWLVRNQSTSFKVIHDWMKGALMKQCSVVKYFIEDNEKVETHEFEGIDETELEDIFADLEGDNTEVEILSTTPREDLTFDLKFKTTKRTQKTVICGVAPENFLISKNAVDKDTAPLVGDIIRKTRGELVGEGYDKDLVRSLPKASSTKKTSTQTAQRFKNEGGEKNSEPVKGWASEEVELEDLYAFVDYDDDGIAERRRFLKCGNKILENDVFDHAPYAMLSSILIPHKAIGRSRASTVMATQKSKSVMLRQTYDNIYMVTNGRSVISKSVNQDDMLNGRFGGVVRLKDKDVLPAQAVFPLPVQFVGDKTLALIQYMDQARAQTTGSLLASQGLNADALNKETATRFNGVEEAGAAKVELIARVFAETGFRQLYEGLAWLTSRYQNTPTEVSVLGKQLTVSPDSWRREHLVVSTVGIGAGTGENSVENLSSVYSIQQQLKAAQSPLVDDKKIFNTLKELLQALDMPSVSNMFNDPENPDELVLAENEQLKSMVAQLQQNVEALQNPLAEAETIKARAKLIEAQGKHDLSVEQAAEDSRQFDERLKQDALENEQDLAVELTKIESESGINTPGALI